MGGSAQVVEHPILALDFGGTKLAAALFDPETMVLLRELEAATPADARAGLAVALELADSLLSEARTTAWAVGVSFGGHVDPTTGTVRKSVQVPGWAGIPLAQILAERFAAPVTVRNDGTAGAVGEWATGAGRGMSNLVYLTVSTGVGGGLVLGGQPYEGASGLSAEFGHLRVPGGSEPCTCGSIGCLETVAAGRSIARAAATRRSAGEATSLPEPPLTAVDVAAHASLGDPLSIDILETAGRAIGFVASAIIASVDPDAIIIGGGVSHAGAVLWDAIHGALVVPFPDERTVPVLPAYHPRDAPLRGAAALARTLCRG
jgi:glucokinase